MLIADTQNPQIDQHMLVLLCRNAFNYIDEVLLALCFCTFKPEHLQI